MSDVRISDLPPADPLTGSEVFPVVQDGNTRKADTAGFGHTPDPTGEPDGRWLRVTGGAYVFADALTAGDVGAVRKTGGDTMDTQLKIVASAANQGLVVERTIADTAYQLTADIGNAGALNVKLMQDGAEVTRFQIHPSGVIDFWGPARFRGNIDFYNLATPVAKPTVSGLRGNNAALASLLSALASQGLVTDSTTESTTE